MIPSRTELNGMTFLRKNKGLPSSQISTLGKWILRSDASESCKTLVTWPSNVSKVKQVYVQTHS